MSAPLAVSALMHAPLSRAASIRMELSLRASVYFDRYFCVLPSTHLVVTVVPVVVVVPKGKIARHYFRIFVQVIDAFCQYWNVTDSRAVARPHGSKF